MNETDNDLNKNIILNEDVKGQVRGNNSVPKEESKNDAGTYTEEVSSSIMLSITSKLNFIGEHFNVEVDDIKTKLISSLIPFKKDFSELVEKKPDLYGPFWIYTTLVLLVTILGNLAVYLSLENNHKFTYQFNYIPVACNIFYGIGFGMPFLIYILVKFLFAVELGLITSICIYGYSFTVLIPIIFVCLVPSIIVKLIVLGYGLVNSTMFLVYNMYKSIDQKAEKSKYVILGIIILFQVILYATLKFYFFGKLEAQLKTVNS